MRKVPLLVRLLPLYVSVLFVDPGDAAPAEGMRWSLPKLADPAPQDRADRIYLSTQRLARHLLASVHPWSEAPSLMLATESRSDENHVRPNTGIVCGLAFLYRFGPYDERVVGMSRERLLHERILPMTRYLVETHVTGRRPTGDSKPWGEHWQSAHWARSLGRAAWFLDTDLPEELAASVRRVVAHEADRIAAMQPPAQVRADTKAEENAWNSGVLSAAVLLMPGDARRSTWETQFHTWALSSFLRAADKNAMTLVDGRPISEQFTGANIYDDFTLENHRIVHPDYMTAFSLLLCSSLDYAMTGRPAPEALLYNVPGIYENLKWFALPDGGFVYPSGQDWTLFRNPDWLFPHVAMAVFGRDPEAWELADRSLRALEAMQGRSPSGQIFADGENFFASAEADKLYMQGVAWLSLHFAKSLAQGNPQRIGVRHLASAKILIHRTPAAVHTVSWGTGVMAQCVPYRLDRIVSPHLRSGVGAVRLADGKEPLAVKPRDVLVQPASDGFVTELVVDHGDGKIRAHLTYTSRKDGTFTVRERLTASNDVRTADIATGLVGILNNRQWIHERGLRVITIDGRDNEVSACSGKTFGAEAVRAITVDGVLRISSPQPLRISYRGASKPERGRATDELILNHLSGERNWRAGETISEYEVTMRCDSPG